MSRATQVLEAIKASPTFAVSESIENARWGDSYFQYGGGWSDSGRVAFQNGPSQFEFDKSGAKAVKDYTGMVLDIEDRAESKATWAFTEKVVQGMIDSTGKKLQKLDEDFNEKVNAELSNFEKELISYYKGKLKAA